MEDFLPEITYQNVQVAQCPFEISIVIGGEMMSIVVEEIVEMIEVEIPLL